MSPAFRSHRIDFVIDDETWAALDAKAAERQEAVAEVVVYAIELFLEREGFSPGWAQQPTEVIFPQTQRAPSPQSGADARRTRSIRRQSGSPSCRQP